LAVHTSSRLMNNQLCNNSLRIYKNIILKWCSDPVIQWQICSWIFKSSNQMAHVALWTRGRAFNRVHNSGGSLNRLQYVLTLTLTFELLTPNDWLERLISEMTCYMSSGMLNSTLSLTHSLQTALCFSGLQRRRNLSNKTKQFSNTIWHNLRLHNQFLQHVLNL